MDNQLPNKKFVIHCAIDWCNALIVQGNRLLDELGNKNNRFENMGKETQNIESIFDKYMKTPQTLGHMVETSFFVYSLNQTILYSRLVQDLCNASFEFIEDFSNQDIKDMRNMTFHADEYIMGKGNFQNRFVHTTENIACDATSIICDDSGTKIGNRINLEKTMTNAKVLLNELKILDKKTKWNYLKNFQID